MMQSEAFPKQLLKLETHRCKPGKFAGLLKGKNHPRPPQFFSEVGTSDRNGGEDIVQNGCFLSFDHTNVFKSVYMYIIIYHH